jgi:hypothetical protein
MDVKCPGVVHPIRSGNTDLKLSFARMLCHHYCILQCTVSRALRLVCKCPLPTYGW